MRATTATCKTLTIGCCAFAPDCPVPQDKVLTGCYARVTTLSMTAGRYLSSSRICSGTRAKLHKQGVLLTSFRASGEEFAGPPADTADILRQNGLRALAPR